MVGRNLLRNKSAREFEILAPSRSDLNLLDYNAVVKFIESFQPDIIVHAAGKVGGIQANMAEPVSFLLENLDIGRNIVWASRNLGVNKLINLGSSCMYPCDAPNPLTEEMVLKGAVEPTNEGYALAKITVARLCGYICCEQPEFMYKTLIPCNIYGRYDKFDPKNSHMLPAIIYKLHHA